MDYERKYNELVEAARAVVEGNPGLCKTDEGLGRLSKLLPEKESEDERVRNRIRLCLDECVHSDIIRDYERDECLAYLEKQKCAFKTGKQFGYEEGLEDGIKMNMAEQMGESKEWADELSAEIDRISKRYPEVSFAKLSRVAVHFVRWQKDYSKVVEFDHDREQKPLSTEETELNSIAFLEQLGYTCIPPGVEQKPTNSEKPKEWSEEDEKNIEKLDGFLSEVFCYGHVYVSQKDKEELQSWLKSLRPQPKEEREPMEIKFGGKIYQVHGVRTLPGGITSYIIEDEPGHYDCIINPEEVLGGGYGVKQNGSPYPTKETTFDYPHWKPSEEQMKALNDVANDGVLLDLFNDLLKLL